MRCVILPDSGETIFVIVKIDEPPVFEDARARGVIICDLSPNLVSHVCDICGVF